MAEAGRPSDYTADIASHICRRLAEGESLRSICRADDMPAESTVRLWALEDREGFSAQYTRSRELGYLAMADELLEIADDGANDTYSKEDGTEIVNHDHIARSRLRVDTRKWMLSKALPKIFGDKVTNIHEGGDKPIEMNTVTDRERAKAVALLARKAQNTAGS